MSSLDRILQMFFTPLELTPEEQKIMAESPGCGGCFFLSVLFLFLALYVGASLTDRIFDLYQSYIVGGF